MWRDIVRALLTDDVSVLAKMLVLVEKQSGISSKMGRVSPQRIQFQAFRSRTIDQRIEKLALSRSTNEPRYPLLVSLELDKTFKPLNF